MRLVVYLIMYKFFWHLRWCRISSINSSISPLGRWCRRDPLTYSDRVTRSFFSTWSCTRNTMRLQIIMLSLYVYIDINGISPTPKASKHLWSTNINSNLIPQDGTVYSVYHLSSKQLSICSSVVAYAAVLSASSLSCISFLNLKRRSLKMAHGFLLSHFHRNFAGPSFLHMPNWIGPQLCVWSWIDQTSIKTTNI